MMKITNKLKVNNRMMMIVINRKRKALIHHLAYLLT